MNRTRSGLALIVATTSSSFAQSEFFLTDRSSDAVLRYDGTTGAFIDAFVPSGSGGLDRPVNLVFGPDGNLYVVNFGPGNIKRFDGQTGAFIDTFFSDTFYLEEPVTMLFTNGFAYVLGNDTQNLVELNATTGAYIRQIGAGTMRYAHDMVLSPTGTLFVATENYTQGPLQEWNIQSGALLNSFASTTEVSLATGVAIGPNDDIFMSDWYDREVERYDAATHAHLGAFIADQDLVGPGSLEFRPDGMVYVSGSSGVRRYDATTGAFVDVFIATGSGGLQTPRGFVFRDSGCYADCDSSGGLNIFDYICFGNAYAAGTSYADCDGSGSLNIFDYICFGNAYAAGCP
ncbi:MAG: hypothetical protein H6815_04485 [Phycisphaeraceae bacterium]|nr:hypothetical protein [Phycisphaerales bacterium]MCB9859690.1 hypothetical protein [Phycisphaeraceae bacterium]